MIRQYILFSLILMGFQLCAGQVIYDSLQHLHPVLYYEDQIEQAVASNEFAKVAENYEQLGNIHIQNERKEEAFRAYAKSIHYYGILDDSLNYYRIYVDLADYYEGSQLYQDAADIYDKALQFYTHKNDPQRQMHLCRKLANIYHLQNFPEKERYFLERSLQLNRRVRDTTFEISTLLQKAKLLQQAENFAKALDVTERAARLSQLRQDTQQMSHTYIRMGILHRKIDHKDRSLRYLEQGDSLFQKTPFSFADYQEYKDISDAFIAFEKPEKAYNYLNLYVTQKDSSTNLEQQQAINQIIAQYQQEKQQREIKDLQAAKVAAQIRAQQQRTIIYAFLFGLVVILVSLYYIIRFYQQRIQASEIIVQQKEEINRQRIVDLENNLKIETMQSMLAGQEAERERVAKDLHDSLGGLLSTIKLQFESVQNRQTQIADVPEYQKANIMLDEACQEVRNISNNMQPGALVKLGLVPAVKDLINRFQGDYYPEIDFQYYGLEKEPLDNTTALMVYRIIQELLNNSIKYAQATEILVQLTRNQDELIVMVEDDGIGYEMDKVKKGMGTENINSRVNYLKGDLSIHSIPGKGTSTMVNIPLGNS